MKLFVLKLCTIGKLSTSGYEIYSSVCPSSVCPSPPSCLALSFAVEDHDVVDVAVIIKVEVVVKVLTACYNDIIMASVFL